MLAHAPRMTIGRRISAEVAAPPAVSAITARVAAPGIAVPSAARRTIGATNTACAFVRIPAASSAPATTGRRAAAASHRQRCGHRHLRIEIAERGAVHEDGGIEPERDGDPIGGGAPEEFAAPREPDDHEQHFGDDAGRLDEGRQPR